MIARTALYTYTFGKWFPVSVAVCVCVIHYLPAVLRKLKPWSRCAICCEWCCVRWIERRRVVRRVFIAVVPSQRAQAPQTHTHTMWKESKNRINESVCASTASVLAHGLRRKKLQLIFVIINTASRRRRAHTQSRTLRVHTGEYTHTALANADSTGILLYSMCQAFQLLWSLFK